MSKRIHVVPHSSGWATRREGASRVGSTHATQAEAAEAAPDPGRGLEKETGGKGWKEKKAIAVRLENEGGWLARLGMVAWWVGEGGLAC